MEKYIYREYNPIYASYYKLELGLLRARLGRNVKIEHIGSTAVLGLGGKGIVDILLIVKKGSLFLYKGMLEELGFEFRETASTNKRYFFRKDYYSEEIERRLHLHIVEEDSVEGKKMIFFRDYLIEHPEKIIEYAELKKKAALEAKGNGEKYREIKQAFIDEINSFFS